MRYGRKRKLSDEQEQELVAWYRGVQSIRSKCQSLGISYPTFLDVLIRHGVREGETYKDRLCRKYAEGGNSV